MTHRALKAIMHNFLGTYISRYSHYDRYWLFGFLVNDITRGVFDLLRPPEVTLSITPMVVAHRLASARFTDQAKKAGLALDRIRQATLTIETLPGLIEGEVNGHRSKGSMMKVIARAVSDRNRIFQSERSFFVAPHDASIERQSTQH